MGLVAVFGFLAKDAFASLKKEQAAIWDQINNNLVARKEFEMHRQHVEDGIRENSAKLDRVEGKIDAHHEWEINTMQWDGKNRRG